MKLKNQVVSLELAKRLRELGVKQEGYFWWACAKNYPANGNTWKLSEKMAFYGDNVAAFTVAELGGMLPRLSISMSVAEGAEPKWVATSKHDVEEHPEWEWKGHHRADTEADARAKMLIYLLENKLIEV